MRKLKLQELNRITVSEYQDAEKIPVVIILDNIRSAMNVGSFFRTADAFKIQCIYLCGITATPPHKEILKTAIGAASSVKWEYQSTTQEAIDLLKEDFQIVGIEQTDQSVQLQEVIVDTSMKYALVFGNEVKGVSDEVLDDLDLAIEIPQFGTKHSLNVSVCGGITLWHFAQPFLK